MTAVQRDSNSKRLGEMARLFRDVRVACAALCSLVSGYWRLMVATLGASYCVYMDD